MSSGKFILRLSKNQHEMLKTSAQAQAISLNELCMKRLFLPSSSEHLQAELYEAASILAMQYPSSILGMMLFGSFARGDAVDASDIDLLVVLDTGQKITRDLYQRWQSATNQSESRVEPHFVHLPEKEASVSGLWAEMATSGLILFDSTLAIQKHLSAIKELILDGKLVRKKSHGQNYWVHQEVA